MASGSPAVRRRRLASALRRLRGGRTGGEVSRALAWSPSKISRFEQGRDSPPVEEVEKLLDFYGVSDPERGRLLSLARDATERGWWEDYADALPEEYQEFIGLEAEAASVAQWQVETVPGLLQTEEYARQLFAAYQRIVPTLAPHIIDQRVKVRMIRQQVLTQDPPLEYHVVIDESVLLRKMGKRELMHAQLLRLAETADLPNVKLQILPLSSDASLVFNSFLIFGFGPSPTGESALGNVVSTESVKSELYVEGETDTYLYRLVFQAFAAASLSLSESKHLIRQTAETMWSSSAALIVTRTRKGGRRDMKIYRSMRISAMRKWHFPIKPIQFPPSSNYTLNWTKSSLSSANGNCVEVADLSGDFIKVRNSRDIKGPVLRFTPAEWDAFLGGVRNGEFDRRPSPAQLFEFNRPSSAVAGRESKC